MRRRRWQAANLRAINSLIGFLLADCCGGQVGNCSEILSLLEAGQAQAGWPPATNHFTTHPCN